jgi:hypothetical protein
LPAGGTFGSIERRSAFDAASASILPSAARNGSSRGACGYLRRLGVTRRQLLEEVDRPPLKALPGDSGHFLVDRFFRKRPGMVGEHQRLFERVRDECTSDERH